MSLLKKLLIAGILILLILAGVGYSIFNSKALTIQDKTYLFVQKDDNTLSLSDVLESKFGLKYPTLFRMLADRMHLDRWIKQGRYTLKPDFTMVELIKVLREGKLKSVDLVVRPLNSLDKFAGKCGTILEPDSADYFTILQDSIFLASIGFNQYNVYALLIPDTYNVLWHTSAEELMLMFKKQYEKFWNAERLKQADSCKLTPFEVSTLASIVAKETNKTDEMPMVAGMYINRLRIGMVLQADPTVKFALNQPGLKRILNGHLQVNSPYNTYLNKGLPPGPICIPSKQAIDAVLNFKAHNYLFMCAKEDFSGYHNFSPDYKGHLQNASRYRKALDERNIH